MYIISIEDSYRHGQYFKLLLYTYRTYISIYEYLYVAKAAGVRTCARLQCRARCRLDAATVSTCSASSSPSVRDGRFPSPLAS